MEVSSAPKRVILHEDWASVAIGFTIIALAIGLFVLPAPEYGWKTGSELFNGVFSLANLGKIAAQFLFVYVGGALGVLLTGGKLGSFLKGFPLLFLLTLLAQVLADRKSVV